ncbi:M15 family metallopeptidase [Microbacterium sp. NPDC019599]|uniref:M15 family metallopeptidase n=1 Tax=Microbacterium sp. NPDC019599 TaxID=3154690 RepID=UPI0033F3221C
MSLPPSEPFARGRAGLAVVAVIAVAIALTCLVLVLGGQRSAATATASGSTSREPSVGADGTHVVEEPPAREGTGEGSVSASDGGVADGTTVWDDSVPAVAHLDPGLRDAVRRAAADAAASGVMFLVNSGWRSAAYQERLLSEAVAQYGSAAEAARWVATPDTSPHVRGAAIDIGGADAAAWLSHHGAAYGLCQIYANEAWHYELRPEAIGQGCPAMYADPTHDPRMQK